MALLNIIYDEHPNYCAEGQIVDKMVFWEYTVELFVSGGGGQL
jgi:hypothetical protein